MTPCHTQPCLHCPHPMNGQVPFLLWNTCFSVNSVSPNLSPFPLFISWLGSCHMQSCPHINTWVDKSLSPHRISTLLSCCSHPSWAAGWSPQVQWPHQDVFEGYKTLILFFFSLVGAMLGICASIQPLTRTIGPTIGGYLYKHYGVPSFGLFNIIVSVLLLMYLVRSQTKRNAEKNN